MTLTELKEQVGLTVPELKMRFSELYNLPGNTKAFWEKALQLTEKLEVIRNQSKFDPEIHWAKLKDAGLDYFNKSDIVTLKFWEKINQAIADGLLTVNNAEVVEQVATVDSVVSKAESESLIKNEDEKELRSVTEISPIVDKVCAPPQGNLVDFPVRGGQICLFPLPERGKMKRSIQDKINELEAEGLNLGDCSLFEFSQMPRWQLKYLVMKFTGCQNTKQLKKILLVIKRGDWALDFWDKATKECHQKILQKFGDMTKDGDLRITHNWYIVACVLKMLINCDEAMRNLKGYLKNSPKNLRYASALNAKTYRGNIKCTVRGVRLEKMNFYDCMVA